MKDLPRSLGLIEAAALVIGCAVGSGIFIVPNLIARQIASPLWTLAVWLFAALLSLTGGLVFAELGAMLPQSGGTYAYIRRAFGPLPAFLCGWTYFLAIIPAAIAWLGIAFSIFLSNLVPLSPAAQKATGIALILVLSAINYRGAVLGANVQKLLTALKIAGILILAAAGIFSPLATQPLSASPTPSPSQFGAALIACLLCFDGWATIGMVAGELRNPKRNIPLGMFIGVAVCAALYLSANYAYLRVIPVPEIATAPRVAASLASLTMGNAGNLFFTILVLVSITGSINGWVLAGPRIYFAQAYDGLFFKRFASIHSRFLTPSFSITMQALVVTLLLLTGTYETLLSLAMFAIWAAYAVAGAGLFLLRHREPHTPRPFEVPLYPVLPAIFLLVALAFLANTLYTDPYPTLAALALIGFGIPAYPLLSRDRPAAVATGPLAEPES